MTKKSISLDVDPTIMESNMRIVKVTIRIDFFTTTIYKLIVNTKCYYYNF